MTPTPVCNHLLIKQGTPNPFLNYDGTSNLKVCTRCRGSYYLNQDEQRSHWKKHKLFCKKMERCTLTSIASMDLETSVNYLQGVLRHPASVKPEVYHVIKRIHTLMEENVDGASDAAYQLHTIARGIIMYQSSDIMMNVVSCPNMATLLFSDEVDLLSVKQRFVKQHFSGKYGNGRPSEEWVEDNIQDELEKKKVLKLLEQYEKLEESSWCQQPSSMSFCYLYFNLVLACALKCNMTHCSIHDGCGTLRGGDPRNKSPQSLLAAAAMRRVFELWTDPFVLASCGDAMAPAASFAMTAIDYYKTNSMLGEVPLCQKHELVPGLAVDRLVMTCLSELTEGAGSANYSVKILRTLGELAKKGHPAFTLILEDMPLERRATFALASIKWIGNSDGGSTSPFGRPIETPTDSVNELFKAITGMQNTDDENLARSVWLKAADDGELLTHGDGAGFNSQERGFFYYMLESDSFSSDQWKSLDMAKAFKEYYGIPDLFEAPDDPKALLKDGCSRKALGDKRHEKRIEWRQELKQKYGK
ncbi:hypothetical protein ACHAWC_004238 [Mediolabrus comicus]